MMELWWYVNEQTDTDNDGGEGGGILRYLY